MFLFLHHFGLSLVVGRVPYVSKANAGVKPEEQKQRQTGVEQDGPWCITVKLFPAGGKKLLFLDSLEEPGGHVSCNKEGDVATAWFVPGLLGRDHIALHAINEEDALQDALANSQDHIERVEELVTVELFIDQVITAHDHGEQLQQEEPRKGQEQEDMVNLVVVIPAVAQLVHVLHGGHDSHQHQQLHDEVHDEEAEIGVIHSAVLCPVEEEDDGHHTAGDHQEAQEHAHMRLVQVVLSVVMVSSVG